MAATLARRLAAIERRVPRPPAPVATALGPALLAGLDANEAEEARRLWGWGQPCLRGRPARPSWNLGDLSCADLERLRTLVRKGYGLPPEPGDPHEGRFWRPCVDCNGRCSGPTG